ncbi:MAG: excisionase family DNA-binding protein [Chloroflexota bacterium]|nr:excisionase family DNA-binding protein [Chloroflexota bacterium]
MSQNETLSRIQFEHQVRLTMKQAASYLGVSLYKIRQLVEDGILQADENLLDKRERLIPRTELDELIRRTGK